MIGMFFVHLDPNIPSMALPGTAWSFQVLTRVLKLSQAKPPKKVHESALSLKSVLLSQKVVTLYLELKFNLKNWNYTSKLLPMKTASIDTTILLKTSTMQLEEPTMHFINKHTKR